MSIFDKWNFFKRMDQISERRLKQFTIEEKIDKKLNDLECKSDVSKWLFWRRELNRNQSRIINREGMFDRLDATDRSLDEIDILQSNITEILHSVSSCKKLKELNDR
jgi:hypothetical protein